MPRRRGLGRFTKDRHSISLFVLIIFETIDNWAYKLYYISKSGCSITRERETRPCKC